jgi:branched-chain amino acid aminotransferase
MAIQKAEFIWHDGQLVRWDDCRIPFLTHSFHYGLAAFEGIRAYKTTAGTAIFRLREHMKRLLESAHIVLMEVPYSLDQLCDAAVEIVRATQQTACYLRPVAYYGDEAMGLGAINSVHVGIAAFPWGAYLGEEGIKSGIRAKISSFPRRPVHVVPVKGKLTGAYINSVLAKREAQLGGYDEAILLDTNGYVAEASGENLFMVKDGELWTPPLGSAILAGITRDTLLKLAADVKVPALEREISRDMLYCADECFLCGTAAEVTPVREVDNRRIGAGMTGPVTRALQAAFHRVTRGEDPKYAAWLTPVV